MGSHTHAHALPYVLTRALFVSVISVSPQGELHLLYFYLGATLSYYCVLIVSVINQLCEYLGIYCLTLKRPLTKTA